MDGQGLYWVVESLLAAGRLDMAVDVFRCAFFYCVAFVDIFSRLADWSEGAVSDRLSSFLTPTPPTTKTPLTYHRSHPRFDCLPTVATLDTLMREAMAMELFELASEVRLPVFVLYMQLLIGCLI